MDPVDTRRTQLCADYIPGIRDAELLVAAFGLNGLQSDSNFPHGTQH